MTFLVPLGLLALIALPTVVLLHLVRQRRRRVRVPTTVLWQALRVPPERRKRTLPITVLLLLHLLAAAALALALGQPVLRSLVAPSQPMHTAIVLDTSTSMAASDESPSRFAQARESALDLIDSLKAGDTVALIQLSATPRLLDWGGAEDVARLRDALNQLAPAGNGTNLREALHLASGTFSADRQNRVLVLTDAALSAAAEPLMISGEVVWQAFGRAAPNVAITTFASRPVPDGDTALYARITNFDDAPAIRTLRLVVDEQQRDQQAIRIPEGASTEYVWRVPADSSIATLTINGGDVLPQDDTAVLPLQASRTLRVRLISPNATALERALAVLPGLDVSITAQYDPGAAPVDLTVFNGVLPDQLPDGGLLIINPPVNNRWLDVGNLSSSARAESTALDPAFAGVDLSSVRWRTLREVVNSAPSELQPIILSTSNVPLVLRGSIDGHAAVVWAFDVDDSNLPAKLAFPLLTAASVRAVTIGALPATLPPGAVAPGVPLLRPDETALEAGASLDQPGLYRLRDGQGGVAVNFGNSTESNLAAQPVPVIVEQPDAVEVVAVDQPPAPLWGWLIGLTLAVVGAEWWYVYGRRMAKV